MDAARPLDRQALEAPRVELAAERTSDHGEPLGRPRSVDPGSLRLEARLATRQLRDLRDDPLREPGPESPGTALRAAREHEARREPSAANTHQPPAGVRLVTGRQDPVELHEPHRSDGHLRILQEGRFLAPLRIDRGYDGRAPVTSSGGGREKG